VPNLGKTWVEANDDSALEITGLFATQSLASFMKEDFTRAGDPPARTKSNLKLLWLLKTVISANFDVRSERTFNNLQANFVLKDALKRIFSTATFVPS
jgi:hypothetical protein